MIYLDIPAWLSVVRIALRMAAQYGRVRRDAAPGCPEKLDWGFFRFAWSFNRIRRARNLAIVNSFPGRKIVLTKRLMRPNSV
ncbi:hypothetical protein [Acidisphaera sp. L21]|uniref:hypothetical protein n=1 Tax=Acidisphaera sp. L21 TaxID=1641851 RepID=UPI001C20AD99|nr:hypothetical protein [Acidisphaera sp. L21]